MGALFIVIVILPHPHSTVCKYLHLTYGPFPVNYRAILDLSRTQLSVAYLCLYTVFGTDFSFNFVKQFVFLFLLVPVTKVIIKIQLVLFT